MSIKFHGNTSNSCCKISLKTTYVNPNGGARGNVRVTKVSRLHPLGIVNVCTKLNANPSSSC